MRIGYARVSTADQVLDRQLDNLRAAGCERIYQEKLSGKLSSRPEYDKMLDALRPGDVLVVDSFSRLSRSTKDLLDVTEKLKAADVQLISLKDNIDTTTAAGKMLFTVIAALAEFERNTLVERTKDGLKAARARGRVGGRPKAGNAQTKAAALAMYDANTLTNSQIAAQCGVSVATLNRWIAARKRQQLEAGEQ